MLLILSHLCDDKAFQTDFNMFKLLCLALRKHRDEGSDGNGPAEEIAAKMCNVRAVLIWHIVNIYFKINNWPV